MNILPKNVKTSAPHCETSNLSNALFSFPRGREFSLLFLPFFLFQLLFAFCTTRLYNSSMPFFPHILAVAQETKTKMLKPKTGEYDLLTVGKSSVNTRHSEIQ